MTRNPNYGLYAIAVAVAAVGALWLGVPVGTLAVLGVVLVCPLMMFFMMRGMNSAGGSKQPGHDSSDSSDSSDRNQPSGQR